LPSNLIYEVRKLSKKSIRGQGCASDHAGPAYRTLLDPVVGWGGGKSWPQQSKWKVGTCGGACYNCDMLGTVYVKRCGGVGAASSFCSV